MRGDHGEVAQLLEREGGRIYKSSEKRLVELSKSHVAGYAASLPHVRARAGIVAPSSAPTSRLTSGRWSWASPCGWAAMRLSRVRAQAGIAVPSSTRCRCSQHVLSTYAFFAQKHHS